MHPHDYNQLRNTQLTALQSCFLSIRTMPVQNAVKGLLGTAVKEENGYSHLQKRIAHQHITNTKPTPTPNLHTQFINLIYNLTAINLIYLAR